MASKAQAFELDLAKKEKHLLLFFAFLSRYLVKEKSSTKLYVAMEAGYAKASIRHVVTWRA